MFQGSVGICIDNSEISLKIPVKIQVIQTRSSQPVQLSSIRLVVIVGLEDASLSCEVSLPFLGDPCIRHCRPPGCP